jgi:hypothetical protein
MTEGSGKAKVEIWKAESGNSNKKLKYRKSKMLKRNAEGASPIAATGRRTQTRSRPSFDP